MEIISTPPAVEKSVLEFARRSGACFGSLDFAIDDQGEWWFLEINEQGQFLWLDDFNPRVTMMQKFLAFVTTPPGSKQTLEERESLFPSLAEYRESGAPEEVAPEVNVGANFISTE
ncbi:MAG: YheC/YheD family protein [Acidobacteriia bacterium]|nr:YheC/YheD family protein [Terriglobia bacterium]